MPGSRTSFYVGFGTGGVFKTENLGVTLTPVFDKAPLLSIGSIGSVCSAWSVGSFASFGSMLSARSRWSVLSDRSYGAVLGSRRPAHRDR